MRSDERRSHRLNYLLRYYLSNPGCDLYLRAKQMGVSDSTARDYIRSVILLARRACPRQASSYS